MVSDRVIPPFLLANPLRRLIEPRGRVISRIRPFIKKGMKVLDLGSGPGYYTEELSNLIGLDGLVVAIDPSESAINMVKRLGRKNVIAITGSAYSIPFEDGYFDFLFANLMLCCVSDYKRALKEMIRVLRGGSFAYLSVTKRFIDRDPGIGQKEWQNVLGNFEVIRSGASLTQRWAVVRKNTEVKPAL